MASEGALGGPVRALLGPLGGFLGPLGAFLGRLESILGRLEVILSRLEALLDPQEAEGAQIIDFPYVFVFGDGLPAGGMRADGPRCANRWCDLVLARSSASEASFSERSVNSGVRARSRFLNYPRSRVSFSIVAGREDLRHIVSQIWYRISSASVEKARVQFLDRRHLNELHRCMWAVSQAGSLQACC